MKPIFIIAAIFSFLLSYQCTPVKKSNIAVGNSFKNSVWKIIRGKVGDSCINFCQSPFECFQIEFDTRRFKGSDGTFRISGLSPDKNSVYYSSTPYMGFYKQKSGNRIQLYWFDKISWSMDFNRNPMGIEISKVFSFDGLYENRNDRLVFYKEDTKRDTLVLMELKSI